MTVDATLVADSLSAHWEAAAPSPCSDPIDGKAIPVPSLKVVPSFFFIFLGLLVHCNAEL